MGIENGGFDHSEDEAKIKQYEQEIKPYSELGEDSEKGWDSWGSTVITTPDGSKERASLYTDEKIIQRLFTETILEYLEKRIPKKWFSKSQPDPDTLEVVDFGGGDGVMLHTIASQIKEQPNPPKIRPTVIDADKHKLEIAKEKFPELNAIEGSVFTLPFPDNSIDIGLSRMVIQYFSGFDTSKIWPVSPKIGFIRDTAHDAEANQYKMLSEINRVLKPGGIYISVSPGNYYGQTEGDAISEFWNRITAARTGQSLDEVRKERAFTSGNDLEWAATEAGFKDAIEHRDGEDVDWIEWRITLKAIYDRFNIDPDNPDTEAQRKAIAEVFDQLTEASTIPIHSPTEDTIELPEKYLSSCCEQKAVKIPVQRIIFHKPGLVTSADQNLIKPY